MTVQDPIMLSSAILIHTKYYFVHFTHTTEATVSTRDPAASQDRQQAAVGNQLAPPPRNVLAPVLLRSWLCGLGEALHGVRGSPGPCGQSQPQPFIHLDT